MDIASSRDRSHSSRARRPIPGKSRAPQRPGMGAKRSPVRAPGLGQLGSPRGTVGDQGHLSIVPGAKAQPHGPQGTTSGHTVKRGQIPGGLLSANAPIMQRRCTAPPESPRGGMANPVRSIERPTAQGISAGGPGPLRGHESQSSAPTPPNRPHHTMPRGGGPHQEAAVPESVRSVL